MSLKKINSMHLTREISGSPAARMTTVFWDVALKNLVEDQRGFTCACLLHHQGDDKGDRPDDGGRKYL
jgi:hypothetical protein